jgi:UDPglucose 6-dehydrogenase
VNISIIGTGYVGLVTGACLAEKGHRVICVDVDEEKVRTIGQGIPPFFEVGLKELLRKHINARFRATTDLRRSVVEADLSLIAVGTPFDGKEIDLSYVKEAARQIGDALKEKTEYSVVVVKSTVVPGTTDDVVRPILEQASGKRVGKDFGLGMNPEFLTEGQAVADFMNPDRIVLGAIDDKSMRLMVELYDGFDGTPILKTNNKTAEMIKYASNAMLATQISFANEIGNLCSTLGGVDVVDVMKGVHLSYYLRPRTKDGQRVQAPISSFLEAGCGFGGSCLPKDVKALVVHGKGGG